MMIVIFGAAVLRGGRASPTLERRVQAAFAFGGIAAQYMPTGAIGRHGPSEASVMRDLLTSWGVDPSCITCEATGTDTLSSALACAALIEPGQDVYVATSAYHLPRCVMLLRMAGVPARRCPPLRHRLEPYWIAREAAALPWDWLLMWHHLRQQAAAARRGAA